MNAAFDKLATWFRPALGTKSSNSLPALATSPAALLAAIVAATEDAIIGHDASGTITGWNPGAEKLYGYTAAEAIGRPTRVIVPPDRIEQAQRVLDRLGRGEPVERFETIRLRKDGTPVDVAITPVPIRDTHGRVTGAVEIARDLTARNAMAAQVRRRDRELRTLTTVSTAISEQMDRQTVLTRALGELVGLMGVDAAESHLSDANDNLCLIAHYHLPPEFMNAARTVRLSAGEGIPHAALSTRNPIFVPEIDNEARYVRREPARAAGFRSLLCVPILGPQNLYGTFTLYSRTSRVFTEDEETLLMIVGHELAAAVERARLFEEVQRLAVIDGLTGVYNRRHFFDLAERALNHARRYRHPVSALLIDLDRFKAINDTWGHAAGDHALRTVAERACQYTRQVDVLGRYGGDEFTILCPETGSAKAREAAERLRRAISETPIEGPQGPVPITVSVGVATTIDSKTSLADLLHQADQAMYGAKRAGGDRVAAATV